ncbi:hypothetical protein HELRODRAFT_177986 [Helobdella robusta]|uniref:NADH:ubiquinone oxidoreductase intermediate-associated protein 30 domain-containing protein n=1 Tax=Helobdella robusta TaxID=6412 RepID=T1FCK6_HELRO|nr:hypothetical protein HELRODRAFT_177986 [Helobdella robusta]ESN97555.1 hypothetical protein HELRODRAFT_177986 [Helobdella robusta]
MSSRLNNFWEMHRKGKYLKEEKLDLIKSVKDGFNMFPKELAKLKNEIVHFCRQDAVCGTYHNDYEILWKFDKPESLHDWIVTCDSDHNEGKSTADFIINKNKKAFFYGNLDVETPKDGITKNSGYCNISSPHNMLSFGRVKPYDWSAYTHLLMKVRGDGRTYNLVLNMNRYWDVQWNDAYFFLLYTRGGPYWQLSKIPLSKFFLSSKGRVQDKQEAIQKGDILRFGITIADSYPGPFGLEIDFIGLVNDTTHKSEFDYEMYEVAPYLMS